MSMSNKGLTKLVEECGELCQIAAKKINYMDTNHHPDKGRPMSERLEEEIADVMAASLYVTKRLALNEAAIATRMECKLKQFDYWENQE